ncbi:MAG: DNA-3-methyladenine glycosylase I [Lachnospiraceae bacterium]|nr:DNA-3-methyladenine glycosylase I [Lachnospiraceae bacterium]
MCEKGSRCGWAGNEQIYVDYHDKEWGRPLHDENRLFEMLILEGQQAGLSWITILKKRENMREAYDNFDPEKIARYGDEKIEELMNNPGIIRNKLKIKSAVNNAGRYMALKEEGFTLDDFLWKYVNYMPIINHFKSYKEAPAKTELSDRISKDLKKLGFSFVGSTIIYAYMQAIGMVNDHEESCTFRNV